MGAAPVAAKRGAAVKRPEPPQARPLAARLKPPILERALRQRRCATTLLSAALAPSSAGPLCFGVGIQERRLRRRRGGGRMGARGAYAGGVALWLAGCCPRSGEGRREESRAGGAAMGRRPRDSGSAARR